MIDCTLDSVTLVDVLRGKQELESVLSRFSEIGVSHVAIGELLLGAIKSSNAHRELAKTLQLIIGMTVVHGDIRTSVIYAQIRRDLERQGNVIPQNDI